MSIQNITRDDWENLNRKIHALSHQIGEVGEKVGEVGEYVEEILSLARTKFSDDSVKEQPYMGIYASPDPVRVRKQNSEKIMTDDEKQI